MAAKTPRAADQIGLTAWITSGSKSRICFQNFTGGTANLISGYTQKDSDGSLYTGKPAKLSGGLPGAKMANSCSISAVCTIGRIRQVTRLSLIGSRSYIPVEYTASLHGL